MFDETNIKIFSDRDKIRNALIEYMRDYLELDNIDLTKTSYLSYLINVLSVLTSDLVYYNTSLYREFFITKAIQKESVLNLASMLGYTPPLATPAAGQLLIGVPMTFDSEIVQLIFPFNHRYYADKTIFEQENEVVIDLTNADNPTTLAATVRENLVIGGTNNVYSTFSEDKSFLYFITEISQEELQTSTIVIPQLEPYEFYVYDLIVDGDLSDVSMSTLDITTTPGGTTEVEEVWNPYDSLFLIPTGLPGFSYRATPTGAKLFFGNGIIGKQPEPGTEFTITVGVTKGTDGNVISGSILTGDKLYTQEGKTIDYTVVNTAPTTGGKNIPTLDEIRSNAMVNVSSVQRLTSSDDFNNASQIVDNMPMDKTIQILKRSDIKKNEISLFTDMIYDQTIIPMRNETHALGSIDDTNSYNIPAGTQIDVDTIEYLTLFDINVHPRISECTYNYIVNNIQLPVTLTKMIDEVTRLMPGTVVFSVDRVTNLVTITFSFQQIDGAGNYDHVACQVVINSTDLSYEMTRTPDGGGGFLNEFTVEIDLIDDIPAAEQLFYFQIYEDIGDPETKMFDSEVTTTVKRDLSDFMYSQVKSEQTLGDITPDTEVVIENLERGNLTVTNDLIEDAPIDSIDDIRSLDGLTIYVEGVDFTLVEESVVWADEFTGPEQGEIYQITYTKRIYTPAWDGTYDITIYDVPLIDKTYYNNIVNTQDFELQIVQKLINFDVANYKMLTDFVNLKFANTTGKLTNMLYNDKQAPLISINPTSFPVNPRDGERWGITSKDNPWSHPSSPYIAPTKDTGFVAQWSDTIGDYVFFYMSVNDCFLITSEDKIYTFNGEIMADTILDIPFLIDALVWKSSNVVISSSKLVNDIKNALIDEYSLRFGYGEDMYRSELIRTIQNVHGVSHCELLSPNIDVQFNYDIYKDFTQEQLLAYAPDLVYFDTQVINIELR